MVGALTCPVCLELPRHLPVPVCHNGHTVCLTCSRNGLGQCPVCRCFIHASELDQKYLLMYFARCKLVSLVVFRDPQPRGVSLLAGRLIQVVPHRCPHQPCNKVNTLFCEEKNIFCLDFYTASLWSVEPYYTHNTALNLNFESGDDDGRS